MKITKKHINKNTTVKRAGHGNFIYSYENFSAKTLEPVCDENGNGISIRGVVMNKKDFVDFIYLELNPSIIDQVESLGYRVENLNGKYKVYEFSPDQKAYLFYGYFSSKEDLKNLLK